jgi:hypothetical protein
MVPLSLLNTAGIHYEAQGSNIVGHVVQNAIVKHKVKNKFLISLENNQNTFFPLSHEAFKSGMQGVCLFKPSVHQVLPYPC